MEYRSLEEVKDRINRNHACIKELENQIPLQETKEKKLKLLSFIGIMYSWYVTGIYSSNDLERQIIELGKDITFHSVSEPQDDQILIVMTEAGDTGGHTLLVHNWIKWDTKRTYSLAFTDMNEQNVPVFIKKAVEISGGELFFLSGTEIEKARGLLEVSQKFSRILLFHHMEDVIPILAYSNKNWKIPVYFYNHADWRFSFGFSISDVILNLFPFDVDKTVRYRGIPLPYCIHLQFPGMGKMEEDETKKQDKKEIRRWIYETYHIAEGERLIVSMGYGYRYKSILDYDFGSYVRKVIKQSGCPCRFLIIGPDRTEKEWVCLEQDTQGKARALGILPRDEAEQLISGADLYVLSFPQGSSGKSVAEQAGVPCLWLNIAGRGMDQSDTRSAESVSELVEKTLDVLNGNGDKYQVSPDLWRWGQTEWVQRWEDILERFSSHSVHTFRPQKRIEKQEYVNCQVLQEEAAKQVLEYLMETPVDKTLREEVSRLDRKYDMGLSYLYIKRLEEHLSEYIHLSNKHLCLYTTAMKWLEIKQKDVRIDECLHSRGYRTVAIYGMSDMGKSLAKELSGGLVRVIYGIDKRAESLDCEIKVFLPSDKLEKVDVILNTTTIANADILASLTVEDSAEMLCLEDLFEEIS